MRNYFLALNYLEEKVKKKERFSKKLMFEDGNGRTARLLSGYILDVEGYGFNGIGS